MKSMFRAVLLLVCFFSPTMAESDGSGIQGTWDGVLEAGAVRLSVVIHVSQAADGSLTANLDSPDQGALGIPIDTISFENSILRFELKGIGASFQGTLNKERSEIVGEFQQGRAMPLVLTRRATKPMQVVNDGWKDLSSHETGMVKVNGVNLHYLDWGGRGEPLLLLAGLFSSAHSFDDIAPKFADNFRVLALTRRGHGRSDTPVSGYALETLVEDIRQFLDAKKIDRVCLAGVSAGGVEAAMFAARYPDRVRKVVYLDSAYDHSTAFASKWKPREDTDPIKNTKMPFPPAESCVSFAAFHEWYENTQGQWSPGVEANLRDMYLLPDGTVKRVPVSFAIAGEIIESGMKAPPDYSKVTAPALAVFAVSDRHPNLPADADADLRRLAQKYVDTVTKPMQREQIEQLRKCGAKVTILELPGVTHSAFMDKDQDQIIKAIKAFLTDAPVH